MNWTHRLVATGVLLALSMPGCDRSQSSAEITAKTIADGGPGTIGAVQGEGARSPWEGKIVSVQGVVTGNFVSGLSGFFIQDATGAEDGDAATSDGLLIEWGKGRRPAVRRGDRVQVLGRVVENGTADASTTALTQVEVEVLGRGAVRAIDVVAPPASPLEWERLEGMWLRLIGPLTISGNHRLLRYGELLVAFGGRLRAPTDLEVPGPSARQLAADNARRALVLDDGRVSEYPDRLAALDAAIGPDAPWRAGSVIHRAEGVLEQRNGLWHLQLLAKLAEVEQATRPAAPVINGALRLVSANLLNLMNGDGRGGGFPTSRGARSHAEYKRQREKLVALVAGLKPDIVAISEMENDGLGELSAQAGFLKSLNAAAGGANDYRGVDVEPPASGTDLIRVALIYRASMVEPDGVARTLTSGAFTYGSRPPLAQDFRVLASGRRLRVVANHFKSKGGCPKDFAASPGNADAGDGQGCWNAQRVESARLLDAWVRDESAPELIALLGDFNAYSQEDPLRLLRGLGWVDAFAAAGTEHGHSFVFDGRAGRLDHALVNKALAKFVVGAAVWSINSDENEAFSYSADRRRFGSFPADAAASSDHDPILIRLDL